MYDIFKDKSIPVIKKYKKENITLGECSKGDIINTTAGDNWAIAREEGKWIPQIGKTFKFSGNNSNYILYNSNLDLPQNIVSYNELSTGFSSIKKLMPEVQDAISSPDKEIIGIFTSNKLTLYPYSNSSIGKSALDINLNEGETMIMAQWASGNYIDDWTKTFNTSFPQNLQINIINKKIPEETFKFSWGIFYLITTTLHNLITNLPKNLLHRSFLHQNLQNFLLQSFLHRSLQIHLRLFHL